MHSFLSFIFRILIAVPVATIAWLISFLTFDYTFWISTAISAGAGLSSYWLGSMYFHYRFLKKHQVSRKEYQYISKNLDDAKRKIYRLHKALLSIRHLPSFTQRVELSRLTRKIYGLTKKEPRRFYKAERFYFSYLDSAVELSEKYALLSNQPKRNREVEEALIETRRMLGEVNRLVEENLYHVLSDDIDQLQFEIDVAKQMIDKDSTNKR